MKEGVVAPEVWIDSLGGRCATDLTSLAGTAGLVNAFTVWVGVRVVVVSPAGAGLDLRRVARSLRDLLGVREMPVIQVLREHEHGVCATADHGLWSGNPGDLARAVAYGSMRLVRGRGARGRVGWRVVPPRDHDGAAGRRRLSSSCASRLSVGRPRIDSGLQACSVREIFALLHAPTHSPTAQKTCQLEQAPRAQLPRNLAKSASARSTASS